MASSNRTFIQEHSKEPLKPNTNNRTCTEGQELRELWLAAELPCTREDPAYLVIYEENLQQTRGALRQHLEHCIVCKANIKASFDRRVKTFWLLVLGILA